MTRLKLVQLSFLFLVITSFLTSCEMIGDILQAGMWVGVLAVVGIIALILWLIGKSRK